MPTRNQLQRQLALACARVTGDQHSHTQHIHENAMQSNGFGQLPGDEMAQRIDYIGGRQRSLEQGRIGLFAATPHDVRNFTIVGHDQCRRTCVENVLHVPRHFLGRLTRRPGALGYAENLNALRMHEIEMTDQVCRGHAFLGRRDRSRQRAAHPLELEPLAIALEEQGND